MGIDTDRPTQYAYGISALLELERLWNAFWPIQEISCLI